MHVLYLMTYNTHVSGYIYKFLYDIDFELLILGKQ